MGFVFKVNWDNAFLKKDCIHLFQAVVPPVPPRRDYVVERGTKVYPGKHPRGMEEYLK